MMRITRPKEYKDDDSHMIGSSKINDVYTTRFPRRDEGIDR